MRNRWCKADKEAIRRRFVRQLRLNLAGPLREWGPPTPTKPLPVLPWPPVVLRPKCCFSAANRDPLAAAMQRREPRLLKWPPPVTVRLVPPRPQVHPCGREDLPDSGHTPDCTTCAIVRDQEQIFADHHLTRLHRGYSYWTEKVKAKCNRCGDFRYVSATALNRYSATPCLRCDGKLNQHAPHYVYVVHFPNLGVFKFGLSGAKDFQRLVVHQRRGGRFMEYVVVENHASAKRLEDQLKHRTAPYRAKCARSDFPQGGYTETWTDDFHEISILKVAAANGIAIRSRAAAATRYGVALGKG